MKKLLLTMAVAFTLVSCIRVDDNCYNERICYEEYVGTFLGADIYETVCYRELVCY